MKDFKKIIGSVIYHSGNILLAIIMLYPIIWLISSSLKDSGQVFIKANQLIPDVLHFENYINGWAGFGNTTFATFFTNSIVVTALTTIGYILSCSLVAFALVRTEFKFKGFWFATVMLCMMLPKQVLLVPQYILFHKFNWINTFKPIIVPAFFAGPSAPFFIFLIMQFIRGIPKELDEAATIDGCGTFKLFFYVIAPLIKPALVTVGIFAVYWQWQDFVGPLLYLNKPELYTVSLALKLFSDPSTVTNWGNMFAMSVLSLVPVVIIFFLFQKYIVEGISTTGLKG